MGRLNDLWPGIEDQVEVTNVATPYTWWRYTRNRQGAFEGIGITDKAFSAKVKRTLPGLDNFFMAGQWVVPGGGVNRPWCRESTPPCFCAGMTAKRLGRLTDPASKPHSDFLPLHSNRLLCVRSIMSTVFLENLKQMSSETLIPFFERESNAP